MVRLFIATGVAPARLAAIGYADHKPVEVNDTAEGRSRNRRVTLMILEDLTAADAPPPANASPLPANASADSRWNDPHAPSARCPPRGRSQCAWGGPAPLT